MPTKLEGRKVTFSHFGFSCIDVYAMTKFYTEVMGMSLSDQGPIPHKIEDDNVQIVFLTTDPDDHHQLVLASGRPKDSEIDMSKYRGGDFGASILQMSFRLDSLDVLRSMVERFKGAGITSFGPTNHGNAWAVYTRDIEGNPVELFVDTPWYVSQPFGEPLDLSMSDEEIFEITKTLCGKQPEMDTYAAWSERMAKTIVENQASI